MRHDVIKNYKVKLMILKNKHEQVVSDLEVKYTLKANQTKLWFEHETDLIINAHKEEIIEVNQKNSIVTRDLEEKLSKVRKEFKEIMTESAHKIKDLQYDLEFTHKQMFKKYEEYEDLEKNYKEMVVEKSEIIDLLQDKLESIDEANLKKIEEIRLDCKRKMFNHNLEHEKELKAASVKSDIAYNDLRIFYEEMVNKLKSKYKGKIEFLEQEKNEIVENLSTKLALKSKIAKQHKQEIGSLKLHVKYLDSAAGMFSPNRASLTPNRTSLEGTRKSLLLKPIIQGRSKSKKV